jgi:hypothetical protein
MFQRVARRDLPGRNAFAPLQAPSNRGRGEAPGALRELRKTTCRMREAGTKSRERGTRVPSLNGAPWHCCARGVMKVAWTAEIVSVAKWGILRLV